jgi:uncharacterized membrane protein YphA (DoxX/SURF4 family)
MSLQLKNIDLTIIAWARRLFVPIARVAFFVIYFYFGILKVFNLSPATPLAEALTTQTIGMQYFHSAYIILAVFECLIGILFLIPRATRLVIPVLFVHMLIVCSPLILVPQLAWVHPFVPSLEGQYIIKNVALIAVAIGIVASTMPLVHKSAKRPGRQ